MRKLLLAMPLILVADALATGLLLRWAVEHLHP